MNEAEVVCDLENYTDPIHYSPEVNRHMVEVMAWLARAGGRHHPPSHTTPSGSWPTATPMMHFLTHKKRKGNKVIHVLENDRKGRKPLPVSCQVIGIHFC